MLRAAVVGRTILQARALHPAIARTLTPQAIRALRGRRVERVERRAKHQLLYLDDGRVLEVHFKMTGDWSIGRSDDSPPPLERARLVFDNGTRVSLIDSRALAVMRVHEAGQLKLPPLGPEPTGDDFNATQLRAALASRRIAIKQALLDQRVVAGLGNIYVAEALWEAKISVTAPGLSLTTARCERLVKAVRLVLERAPAERYFDKDGRSLTGETALAGMNDDAWRVYGREAEPCGRCKTKIKRIAQGGRSTFYCPHCQKR